MNLATFDLNLLRILDALLRENSTVGAGRRVGLSQPAVSAALGRLRAALGDPLFVRNGQSLQPTAFALGLAQPLRDVLEQTERLLSRSVFDPATAQGILRLAAADFFTEMLLADLMAVMRRDAPGLALRYVDALGRDLLTQMRSGGVDVVLLPSQICPDWLDHELLIHIDFRVVARRDHPALIRGLPLDLYCALEHASFRVNEEVAEEEDRVLATLGRTRRIVLSVPNYTAVWRAVAATDLIGIVPGRLAERVAGPAGLAVHPVPFALPRVMISQAWHPRNTAAPGLVWLRGQIRNLMSPLDDGPG